MTKIEEWIAARIAECSPTRTSGRSGAAELLRALPFFSGKATQIFGMMADRSKMPELASLRAACKEAIRAWYEECGRTDPAFQVDMYQFGAKHPELGLAFAEPPWVAEQKARMRELQRERDARLLPYGRPSDTLAVWPGLQQQLSELRGLGARVPFDVVMSDAFGMFQFEWYPDDWASVGEIQHDPAFYPLAGADGDCFGLLLDTSLASQGIAAPLVHYSHEHSPVYEWVFESCATAVHVFSAAAMNRPRPSSMAGSQHAQVTELLQAMNDFDPPKREATRIASWQSIHESTRDAATFGAFEKAGNIFAVRSLAVWEICNRYHEEKQKMPYRPT
ncbi:hypothetical protein LVJ94_07895 [Pendulispora rubella]|uniref:Knr4/Smi1-like domain-containing protein n=1 Tax=Pendulispora rubella TaxID=2741070 RepID=A0ABZ2LBI2_9BACT